MIRKREGSQRNKRLLKLVVQLPKDSELRGLRILQAQVNPYHPSNSYTVDLKALEEDDPDFLEDLKAGWDYISRLSALRETVSQAELEAEEKFRKETALRMKKLWQDPEYVEKIKAARKRKRAPK